MLELGGEHILAQRLPCRRGDALDVGAVTGPDAGISLTPGRVRRSEQPGGPAGPAVECVRAGQAGEGLGHGLRIPEFLRGGEALKVPCARLGLIAALLGDEAELGQGDGPGHVRFGAGPVAGLHHVAYVGFGLSELAFPARYLAEA